MGVPEGTQLTTEGKSLTSQTNPKAHRDPLEDLCQQEIPPSGVHQLVCGSCPWWPRTPLQLGLSHLGAPYIFLYCYFAYLKAPISGAL